MGRVAHHLDVPRAQRGTTLLELMVGLMILTVITSIALPALSSLTRRQNLRQAGEDLVYAAEQARSKARSQRRAYGLIVGAGGGTTDPLKVEVWRGKGTNCSSIASCRGVDDAASRSQHTAGRSRHASALQVGLLHHRVDHRRSHRDRKSVV